VTGDDEKKPIFGTSRQNSTLLKIMRIVYHNKTDSYFARKKNFAPAYSIMNCTRFLGKICMMKKILGVARQPCRDGGYRPEIDTGNIGFPPVLPLFPHIFVEIHQSPHCKPLAFSVC
jgi:hypothetical protein